MDDLVFLARVRELLTPPLGMPDLLVTDVRPAGGRPWLRIEVVLELTDLPPTWEGPRGGSAYLPLTREWRDASGIDEPADYVLPLISALESAAGRLHRPRPPSPEPTPAEVEERWQWLLERLALSGTARADGPGRLVVEAEDGPGFTVIVTPEQWARIATPVEPDADDPQEFYSLQEDETYLVFHEDALVWSIRPDLPPVPGGAELRRRVKAALARGENVGWFAYLPGEDR
jgi:hypothetical protein